MWRETEFDQLDLQGVLDRMVRAFDAVGDPTFRFARPGRSEDEVIERLSEIVEEPHPDLVSWFCFIDGHEDGRQVAIGGADHALSLDAAVGQWRAMQPEIEAGVYAEARPTFVPFLYRAAISCDAQRLPGAVMDYSPLGIESFVPSLRHVCWHLTALRDEGIFYYTGETLPLERVFGGFEEWEALKSEFMIQRLLADGDDRVFPIGVV